LLVTLKVTFVWTSTHENQKKIRGEKSKLQMAVALAAPCNWVRCSPTRRTINRGRVCVRALEDVEDDDVLWLTSGTSRLPPLVEATFPLQQSTSLRIVKPPGVDELWEWYEKVGYDDSDPSWGRVWKTASDLSALVLPGALPACCLRGKTVVEVGCGLGFVGLAAAMTQGSRVIFCDREPLAIHCALSSAQLNGLEVHSVEDISKSSQGVAGAVLDWASPLHTLAQSADVVLGADCLYDPATAAMLANTCKHVLGEDGVVVICEPELERAKGTYSKFLEAAKMLGAASAEIFPHPDSDEPRSILLRVSWKSL